MASESTHGINEIDVLRAMASRIRELIIRTVHHASVGHVGGPLSMAEILSALYFRILRIRHEQPDWPERDHFLENCNVSVVTIASS